MKLTAKEVRVLNLLAQDKSAKEIADICGNSVFTIQCEIRSAKIKLGVGTCHGAVAKIIQLQNGIICNYA
jgi:DNA-binding CsgD family transcriptional regulator